MNDASSSSAGKPANQTTRRQFGRALAGSAIATMAVPTIVRGRGLNEKLNIAVIGSGGRGSDNLRGIGSENIVALCDVYEPNIDKAALTYSKAKRYQDYRKLFENANDFDAVVVSTPEHTHAFATLPALQLGKHVYCEKPLTHNIAETRIIREAAAKAKVATQMGTQIHATDNYRRVVELVQSGAIGPVSEAHVWVDRAWGWQSDEAAKRNKDRVSTQDRPKEASEIPTGLNWELWLGPAVDRAFNSVYFPGPKWYRWWDFGSGTMSDLGSHWNDLAFWALKLDAPKTAEAFGPPAHPDLAPASMHVTYEYGARGNMPPVKMTWYQGEDKPEIWTRGGLPNPEKWRSAALFIGSKGMVLADYSKHILLPEADFKDFKRPEPFIAKSLGHYAEWINACKTGDPTTCNFDYSGRLTEANHLGNVAYRVGKKVEWDAAKLYCPNAPEAERYIHREYRKGWKLA